VTAALGAGLAVRVGVKVEVRVASGVTEGVRASACVTCANTVPAISVRRGFRSRVGVLAGIVGVLAGIVGVQAADHSRLKHTPIRLRVLFLYAIRLFLCSGW
jgi:hypothetical protein